MRTGIGLTIALLVGLTFLALSPRGQGQPEAVARDVKKITITGTGTVVVAPDTARIVFAVSGEDKGEMPVGFATKRCNDLADKVELAVTGLRLEGFSIKRGPLNVITPEDKSAVEFSRTFVVTLKADKADRLIRLADKVLLIAIENGATATPTFNKSANTFYGVPIPAFETNSRIDLYNADLAKARSEALKKAVEDAMENARTLAGTAKVTIKEIVTVTDQASTPFGGGMPAQPSIRGEVHGEVEVTMSVIVTCTY